MGITQGTQTTVYLGGGDATNILNKLRSERKKNTVPRMHFGQTAEEFVAITSTSEVAMEGYYDPDSNLPPDVLLAAQDLTAIGGASGTGVVLYSWFAGDGLPGDRGEGGYVLVPNASTNKAADGITDIALQGVPAAQTDLLQLLFKMQTVTGNGSSAPLASTTPLVSSESVAHLHVQASNGTATIKIYHKNSADSSWIELFSFSVSSGRSSNRNVVATALKDEIYVGWTLGTATSLTFAAAIGAGTTGTVGVMPGMLLHGGLMRYNQSFIAS